jgi:hypothetical protein
MAAQPEYDRFAEQAREAIARQLAATERTQEQTRELFAQGEGNVSFLPPSD